MEKVRKENIPPMISTGIKPLSTHLSDHNIKEYHCRICQLSYLTKKELDTHESTIVHLLNMKSKSNRGDRDRGSQESRSSYNERNLIDLSRSRSRDSIYSRSRDSNSNRSYDSNHRSRDSNQSRSRDNNHSRSRDPNHNTRDNSWERKYGRKCDQFRQHPKQSSSWQKQNYCGSGSFQNSNNNGLLPTPMPLMQIPWAVPHPWNQLTAVSGNNTNNFYHDDSVFQQSGFTSFDPSRQSHHNWCETGQKFPEPVRNWQGPRQNWQEPVQNSQELSNDNGSRKPDSDLSSDKTISKVDGAKKQDSDSPPAHTLELSLKASQLIDNVLKGNPSSVTEIRSERISRKSSCDILEKAERLCQNLREQRREANENRERNSTDKCVTPAITTMPQTRPLPQALPKTSPALVRGARLSTDIQPNLTGSHRIRTSSRTSNRKDKLKDMVVNMIKYPNSRRATAKIEKILMRSPKMASGSRNRLLTLMKPLSERDDSCLEFGELDPEVQDDILSLIDQVMVDVDPEELVILSDDDMSSGFGSPPYNTGSGFGSPPYNAYNTPLDSRQPTLGDVSSCFEDLLADGSLHTILSSASLMSSDSKSQVERLNGPSCESVDKCEMLVSEFPLSVQEGLKIVDRVINETNQSRDCAEIRIHRPTHGTGDSGQVDEQSFSIQEVSGAENKTCDGGSVMDKNTDNLGAKIIEQAKKEVDLLKKKQNIPNPKIPSSSSSINHSPYSLSTATTTCVSNDRYGQQSTGPSFQTLNDPSPVAEIITIKPEPDDDRYDQNTSQDHVILIDTSPNEQPSASAAAVVKSEVHEDITTIMQEITNMETGADDHQDAEWLDLSAGEWSLSSSHSNGKRLRELSSPEKVSQDNLNTRSEPKRPKVADSDAESSVVDELYRVSMEEESVRRVIVEVDQSIAELKQKLDKMNSKKLQLSQQEERLREKRLMLLRGARGADKSENSALDNLTTPTIVIEHINATSSVCDKPSAISERNYDEHPCQEDTHVNEDIAGTAMKFEDNTQLLIEKSSEIVETDTHMLLTVPVSALKDIKTESREKKDQEIVEDVSLPDKRKKSNSFSFGDENLLTNLGDNVSAHYLGSFSGNEDMNSILNRLGTNFRSVDMLVQSDPSVEPSEVVDSLPVIQSSQVIQSDHDSKVFKVPEVPKPNVRTRSSREHSKSDSEIIEINDDSESKKKSKLKALKNTRKTGKAKKSNKSKKETTPESTSESEPVNDSSVKGSSKKGKKKKLKLKDRGTSEIMKDYLHCSSSTDVEIEGLEPTTSTNVSLKSAEEVASSTRSLRKSSRVKSSPVKMEVQGECDSSSDIVKPNKGKVSKKIRVPQTGIFQKIQGAVSCVFVSENKLAVTGCDGKISIFSRVKIGEPLMRILTHSEIVRVLHVRADAGNTYMYSAGTDRNIVISNFKSGTYFSEHQCQSSVLCGSTCWGKLYLGHSNGTVTTFDLAKYRIESTKLFSSSGKVGVSLLATAQEGSRRLLCIVEGGQASIMVKDARDALFIRSLEGHTKQPLALQVKNHLVFSGGADKMVQIHNLNTGEMETLLRFQSAITQIIVQNVLIVGERRGIINIIERKTQQRERVIYTYDHSPVTALAFDEKHQMLYVGEETGRLEALPITGDAFECKFSACQEYTFGSKKHILYHIIHDHVKPCVSLAQDWTDNSDNVLFKCLWKGCNESVTITDDAKDAEEHMMQHIEAED